MSLKIRLRTKLYRSIAKLMTNKKEKHMGANLTEKFYNGLLMSLGKLIPLTKGLIIKLSRKTSEVYKII